MGLHHTYEEIAQDYRLWQEFADPDAVISEAEFNRLSVAEKVRLQTEAHGPEAGKEE